MLEHFLCVLKAVVTSIYVVTTERETDSSVLEITAALEGFSSA